MRYCPQCDFLSDDSCNFCPNCGARMRPCMKQDDSSWHESPQSPPQQRASTPVYNTTPIANRPPVKKQRKTRPESFWRAIRIVVILSIVFLSIVNRKDYQRYQSYTSNSVESQSQTQNEDEEKKRWAVYLMAEQQIADYISCPSTMKFCVFDQCDIRDVGFNIWKGEGYFDAENLYGATVRSKWNITCTIEDGIIHMAKLKIDDIVVYSDGTQ